jgi:hypothetical protein
VVAVQYPVHLTKAGGGGDRKSLAYKAEQCARKRDSYAVARASPGIQATRAQVVACGYTGLEVCASGAVKARAYRNGKRKYLGAFGDVQFSGAQPGGSNYNAVEQQMDADGAPIEFSRCT